MRTDASKGAGRLRLAAENGARVGTSADRDAPRYRTFLAGKIRVADGSFLLCVIRDMSKTGARLVVDPKAELPKTFELHVLSRNEVFHGKLVWRENDLAGMRFTAWRKD